MENASVMKCGICGAELPPRHIGTTLVEEVAQPICYCERCNAFYVPIGEDGQSAKERLAKAKREMPPRWSSERMPDGATMLVRRASPLQVVAFFAAACTTAALVWLGVEFLRYNTEWPLSLCLVLALISLALAICTAGRIGCVKYRLDMDALSIETRWLGFIPVLRRRYERTPITCGAIERCGKDFVAVWRNGFEQRTFWRGRDRQEADFIDATILEPFSGSINTEPLLCAACGAEFRPEDINMPENSIVCRECGAIESPEAVHAGRYKRFSMRFRPHGIVDIPGGFEYREKRWFSGRVSAAISGWGAIAMWAAFVAKILEDVSAPWDYIALAAIVCALAIFPAVILFAMTTGRFAVHRIVEKNGIVSYFHGIGRFGRRVEFPVENIVGVSVVNRGSNIDRNAVTPCAIAVLLTGETREKRIFCHCSPGMYHWADTWLEGKR